MKKHLFCLVVFILSVSVFVGCSKSGGDNPATTPNPTHVYNITTEITPYGDATLSPDGYLYYYYPTQDGYSLTAKILDNGNEIEGDIVYTYTHIYGGSNDLKFGNWLTYPQQTKNSAEVVDVSPATLSGEPYHEFKFDLTAHGVTKTLTFRVVPNPD